MHTNSFNPNEVASVIILSLSGKKKNPTNQTTNQTTKQTEKRKERKPQCTRMFGDMKIRR